VVNVTNTVIGDGSALVAADADLTASLLTITEAGAATDFPQLSYPDITSIGEGILPSLVEVSESILVTPTSATNSSYVLDIAQFVPELGRTVYVNLSHLTPQGGSVTATTICNNWRTELTSYDGTGIEVTGTGTATLILTANVGSPLFDVTGYATGTGSAAVTIASNMPFASSGARGGATTLNQNGVVATILPSNVTSIAQAGGVITVTHNSHGLVAGATVTISGAWGGTIDGVSGGASTSATARVGTVATNTFVMEGLVGAGGGFGIGTATITVVAQEARGQGADLIDAGVDATSGQAYSTLVVGYNQSVGQGINGLSQKTVNQATLYINEGNSGFGVFETQLDELLSGYTPTTTDANPEAFSKQ
jgi:hypothetical protein